MARPSTRSKSKSRQTKSKKLEIPTAETIADDDHPEYKGGQYSEQASNESTEFNDVDTPTSNPSDNTRGMHFPGFPRPFPRPFPFPSFCGPVSGRYLAFHRTTPPIPGPFPGPIPGPIITPLPFTIISVRVDVDRFNPQNKISLEVRQLIPSKTSHAIASVTSDACLGWNRRKVEATIDYRDGDPNLIPGNRMEFEARRTTGFGYDTWTLRLMNGSVTVRTFDLRFISRYFDSVEFEVDITSDASAVFTTYNTGSHPNRPASLPAETISLETTYKRAGFDASLSPNGTTIPVTGAGSNAVWSDTEMHNAMVTFWSRFADRPQWAMWVLYARLHDFGTSLGGIMFDDIGPNHRQGTAIFTDTFIRNAPAGDPNPAAWRQRMQYWTAIHEMGHAFNLAHSWQKALGSPWIPLANEPEARSFMNYPFNVAGGQSSFFSDFDFRFSDDELVFMRHAPRRFVQMGNEDWFSNHGFEETNALMNPGATYRLELRPNRDLNNFSFMEPVNLELKLTNVSGQEQMVEEDILEDGHHSAILITRENGTVKRWRPFVTRCHLPHADKLKPDESLFASHFVGASTSDWLIDEPGFYKAQAITQVNGEIVMSNVMRFYVSPPASDAENQLAPDYFSEDVGRVLAFNGAPELSKAHDVLGEVVERCAGSAAATHAAVALSAPMVNDFKVLKTTDSRQDMTFETVSAKLDEAAKIQTEVLMDDAERAAQTMGHISYGNTVERLSKALFASGEKAAASKVQTVLVKTMEKRGVLKSVVDGAKRSLARMKK